MAEWFAGIAEFGSFYWAASLMVMLVCFFFLGFLCAFELITDIIFDHVGIWIIVFMFLGFIPYMALFVSAVFLFYIVWGFIDKYKIRIIIPKFKYTFIFYWKKDKSNFKKQAIKHLKQIKE